MNRLAKIGGGAKGWQALDNIKKSERKEKNESKDS